MLNHARPTQRRAFSMLEVMLATITGVMVLIACLSLLTTMRRGDAVAAQRFEASMLIERTQRTTANALGQLLMSGSYREDLEAERNRDDDNPNAEEKEEADDAREGEDADDTITGQIRLSLAPARDLPDMVHDVDGEFTPQRLEVTTISPPIFRPPGGPRLERAGWASTEARADVRQQQRITEGRGYLGAFEFVPADEEATSWQLWYSPITPSGESVLLIDDLAYARWSAFQSDPEDPGRGRYVDRLQAAYAEDLPGFMTLEVNTLDGQWHNWMFELRWLSQTQTAAGTPEVDTDGDGIPDTPAAMVDDDLNAFGDSGGAAPADAGDKPAANPGQPGSGSKPPSRFGGLKDFQRNPSRDQQ